MESIEKHDLETQATIERERITTAAVKQLKAEIKEEKTKHEEEVTHRMLLTPVLHATPTHCYITSTTGCAIDSHLQNCLLQ